MKRKISSVSRRNKGKYEKTGRKGGPENDGHIWYVVI